MCVSRTAIAPSNAESSASNPLPQTKGPPGANIFVVRKMRRVDWMDDEASTSAAHA